MASEGPRMSFAVRSSNGFSVNSGFEADVTFAKTRTEETPALCRVFKFSNSGKYFAYCDCVKTCVVDAATGREVLSLNLPKTHSICFSPNDSLFCTWEQYAIVKGAEPAAGQSLRNLHIWNLVDGTLNAEFVVRKHAGWQPQFTDDETLGAQIVAHEILFKEPSNFEKTIRKLKLEKLDDFSLSRGPKPYHVACYIPALKGQPAIVKVCRAEQDFRVIANKTFFKSDRASFNWNSTGTAVIVMSITDVDSTGQSYYGEQNIYLVLTNGDSFRVHLAKQGPVYSVDWNPNSQEFCAVYGFMPAQATMYNLKGEVVFDMGVGPRNEVHYNRLVEFRFGNLLLVCGFGNLTGNMEFWSPTEKKLAAKFVVPNTTLFSWAPDGQHFIAATTTPRLRIDNGYRIWHYTGYPVLESKCEEKQELYEVIWRPEADDSVYPEFAVKYLTKEEMAKAGMSDTGTPKSALPEGAIDKSGRYVPPHMRNGARPIGMQPAPGRGRGGKRGGSRGGGGGGMPAAANQGGAGGGTASTGGGQLTEAEKKMRNLKKKMDQILKLKLQMEAGEKMEKNQLDKISKESEVQAEMNQLSLESFS